MTRREGSQVSDTETIAEAAAEDLDAARPVQMPLPGTGKALTLDAGGEPPDSAEVKIVGGAIPLAGQFEQLLNARYLEREGFGLGAVDLTDPQVVARFVARIPEFARALAGYQQDGNRELLTAVDHFLSLAATQVT